MRGLLWLLAGAWAQVVFYVEPVRYYTPEGQPYVELFIGVDASSVRYVARGGVYEGEVDFTLIIKNALDAPVYADKFRFVLPPAKDSLSVSRQRLYADIRRLRIPSGTYQIEIEATDPNQTPRPQKVKAVMEFEMPERAGGFRYSDLLFAHRINAEEAPYERHGLRLEPWISNGLLVDPDTLRIYGEVYATDSLTTEPYYLRVRVLDAQRAQEVSELSYARRPSRPKPFEAFVFTLPIRRLGSGIYIAQIELCRNDGAVLASWYRRFTLISTAEPMVEASESEYDALYGFSESKLDELLGGMTHLASPSEKSFMRTLEKFSDKKKFFVAFWKKRQGMPGSMDLKEFLRRFEYAQQHFKSSMRPGWKTDRGRVFIQYGPPNDMQFFYNEPDKYPYQIWTYNQIGAQGQVIFVFYDPDLITNEYPLLHSNKIGEIQNRNWRAFLLRARGASTGETERLNRFGRDGAFMFRDDQTIGFVRDDR
ncbi:MAG: GWxTD domain-containing protein [Bacteroidia bacterium]|nr:GWxTD domain-containing protein [Bacteroidia bacterium]MCX7652971.1 GWxTD domain-containing protein [Bacteroidia bacterium]MDW8417466.1 GWxTD domain-containing protein [Bacteroidia bacterium]